RTLAAYSGLCVRKLRDCLVDPAHPIPCYRVGGKIVVRRSEFDSWIAGYRSRGRADVAAIVDDVLRTLARTQPIVEAPRSPRVRPRTGKIARRSSPASARRVSAADGTTGH